jgi:AcrR family transcriptional regulator
MADTQAPTRAARESRARDTRGEILAVASELFTDKGYDATSLREIAERLGITKAALYYHFRSKEDILAALLEPIGAIVDELLERLEAASDVHGWADTLAWLIDMFGANATFFRLLERNRHSAQALHDSFHETQDHMRMHERVQTAVHAAAANIGEEIRMFAALGAVTAFDDWAPKLLIETPPDVIQRELGAVVRTILGV